MSSDEQVLEDDNSVESGTSTIDVTVDESSMCMKEVERQRIQSEIEAFLSGGGQITQVDTNVTSDPPKRPQSNYGGQPI